MNRLEATAKYTRPRGARPLAKRALAGTALTAALLMAATNGAAAQGEQDNGWIKICPSDPASGTQTCVVGKDLFALTGQFIASVAVRQVSGVDDVTLILGVPLGVKIQPGMVVQIDGGNEIEVAYDICIGNACLGELGMTASLVDAMKGGASLTVKARNANDTSISFDVALAGFSATYDGEALDAETARARQNEFTAAREARAEEVRRKLIAVQQPGAAN